MRLAAAEPRGVSSVAAGGGCCTALAVLAGPDSWPPGLLAAAVSRFRRDGRDDSDSLAVLCNLSA